MLLPKEKPYLANLNSFYIYLDKFLEQMQQEIGSGCFHCSSGDLEFMIYFNQYELVRVVRLEKDKRPEHLKSLSPVMAAFRQRTFMVSIYHLDLNAVYFWGSLPTFTRDGKKVRATARTFSPLQNHLCGKNFSGFIELNFETGQSCLLFYHQGKRMGGSYSWSIGGLSPWVKDYRFLFTLMEQLDGTMELGHFTEEIRLHPGMDDLLDQPFENRHDTDRKTLSLSAGQRPQLIS